MYKDWLHDGIDCYKAKNNEEFIAKLKHILTSSNQDIVDAGYEVAKSRDINLVGSQIKEVYQEVLDQYKNK